MDAQLREAEALFRAGEPARAEALCRQLLARDPDNVPALRLLGILLLEAGNVGEALPLLRRAVQADAGHPGALDALSSALMKLEDPAGAEAVLRRALALDGRRAVTHLRLGVALARQDRWEEAARCLQAATAIDPQSADAHYLLGDALATLNRNAEAIACFRRALALAPGSAPVHNALGHALQELGLHEAALPRYEQALALDPAYSLARHNLGLAHLYRHEFERGWPLYERRPECPPARAEMRKPAATLEVLERMPRWRGPGEPGVTELAVWAEQGIGDQILYSTLLPDLVAAGLPLVYEADRRLLGAYQRAFPGVRFVPTQDPPHTALLQASRVLPAGSLPSIFRPSREAFARQPARMLAALPDRVARRRAQLRDSPARLHVAFSWRSRRAGGPVRMKTAPLADFAELFRVSGARFVDVQYGDTAAERRETQQATGTGLLHFDEIDYFNDLEEVLAILEACDLVITTSNVTAHLAGALGKRTWLLFPADNPPFHYWAPGDDHRSLWYPSVEIVSAARLTDWRALAAEATARLQRETGATGRVEAAAPAADAATRVRAERLAGRLDAAIALARRELERAPGDGPLLSELAHALRWRGDPGEARRVASRAVETAPGLAVAWFNLGAARVESGDIAGGIEAYREAVGRDPGLAEAWSNLGGALGATGDTDGEIDAYLRAVGANPGLAPVWGNLGNALLEAGDVAEALAACRRAVALDAEDAGAWNNLGNALRRHGDATGAVAACRRATELDPQRAEAWSNLGSALMEQGALEASLEAHRHSIALAPGNPQAHYNLGLAQERRGDHAAAIGNYRQALAIQPDLVAARMRLACSLLTRGDFAEGWPGYEWRWRERGAAPKRHAFTAWAGERVPGRRLLLWGEQGLGDELIYAGMIGDLAGAGMRLTLETDPRLVTLMQRSFPDVAVAPRTDPPRVAAADFDCQAPLASLGRWLRPSFAAFPAHAGYLKADPERVAAFARRLRGGGAGPLIGISWRSANREIGDAKSAALEDWAGLLRTPGAQFVDLQYGDTAADHEGLRRRHGLSLTHLDDVDLFGDIEALAALCAACDRVITVSNVTAHVAGALGKPVWLLAPAAKGRLWYWFHGRDDSPWYPSMRVFTQRVAGDWREVLARARQALTALPRGANGA